MLIIGAGISGIGMAAHLVRKCPQKRFALVERRSRLGGTWDLFRYPGIRSDSDMFTLGYAFAPWRSDRSIAQRDEILAYLETVARSHGIIEHIHFATRAVSADWDSSKGLWRVRCEDADGRLHTIAARFLFASTGYYDHDQPHAPPFAGSDRFRGLILHPQFWPDDVALAGKSIVVIGSGATAATLVPALAGMAADVTMLQRTPSWYLPIPRRNRLARILHRLLPEGWAWLLIRRYQTWVQQVFFALSRRRPGWIGNLLLRRARRDLGDRFNAADFTPPYEPWQQRICFIPDSDLFAAIRAGKADIVTGEIAEFDETGILLADGRHLEADIIVTATGLRLAMLGKMRFAVDGQPVHLPDHYYYRGCMFSNLPNFAALFGYLNAAWTARVDLVAEYLCRLLAQMDAWRAQVVIPVLPADHGLIEDDPFAGFTSGYLERGRPLVAKSATTAPWQLRHDPAADRRDMREAPIDDGWLRFLRIPACDAGR
ncbi:MAG: NAD(P)/FAD-dependent oxidoreductase [Novosphingobium sp.]|nr:NAD(P)/FAD-dependent oxidoreductase [Novosphingobium sp.]